MRRSSEETKSEILARARERFAADGYERATIRAVAADAGIDPALVMRYFGSKERLFAAACAFDLQLPDVRAVPRDGVGAALARHFLERWEADETLTILLRTGVTNPAAAERMREVYASQLMPAAAAVAGDTAQAQVRVRAGLAATQVLGMALCRYVLKFPPISAMSRDEAIRWIAPTLQRYLAGVA